MRTSIYVDGFSLYYGAVKGTAWKWLDLKGLFARLLPPHHRITHEPPQTCGLVSPNARDCWGRCAAGLLRAA